MGEYAPCGCDDEDEVGDAAGAVAGQERRPPHGCCCALSSLVGSTSGDRSLSLYLSPVSPVISERAGRQAGNRGRKMVAHLQRRLLFIPRRTTSPSFLLQLAGASFFPPCSLAPSQGRQRCLAVRRRLAGRWGCGSEA
jgi:hypothetical protein